MKIDHIIRTIEAKSSPKLLKAYVSLEKLIEAINAREFPHEFGQMIQPKIQVINTFSGTSKQLAKEIKKTEQYVVNQLEKELGWVKKRHYQNLWMGYGMLAGVLFSTVSTSFGFTNTFNSLGMGISLGLIFGMMVGKNKDTQAAKNGLQLD
tara:strand:- start:35927 stop:36379 length:453 start_codon:yes stop_codon:yes gene_type:complete